ncbi:hypothetical protein COLO4_31959 [Corchorus olitorius]|uniref:Uncharacterized protein n=1 Tax=Corchorus olitorius TaxID=93759 RepID=A0A1R3H2R7_9ROSI|nr:hypothetical protein COLO4_31959 [Corchorus olitorius]
MEEKEALSTGVRMKGDEAPEGYHVTPRMENTTKHAGSQCRPPLPVPPASVATPPGPGTGSEMKKKKGQAKKVCARWVFRGCIVIDADIVVDSTDGRVPHLETGERARF